MLSTYLEGKFADVLLAYGSETDPSRLHVERGLRTDGCYRRSLWLREEHMR